MTPPAYLALDLWVALGMDSNDFDAYYERNGWADTWANLLAAVRDKPTCWEPVDPDDYCCLSEGHGGPHYGSRDVGLSEPLPLPKPPEAK
jgi:hypothetical protein